MKNKILYVSANGYLGGAERFVLTACTAHQSSKAFEASILFFKDGEAVELARNLNIPFYVLNSSFKLKNLKSLWKSLHEIRILVKKIKPQIIHNTMPYTHIVMCLATFGLGLKKVWFQHGPVGGLLDKIASLFHSHLLIFNSSFLQKNHHSTSWFERSKKEIVLKLGISSGEKRKQPIFSGQKLKLGTSGRICDWKGFHIVIQAIGELAATKSLRPFTYSIAGSPKNENDKIYHEKLKSLVAEYSLQDKVVFLGHQNQLIEFYNELDVFIHASTIPEPFGLVAAEAMAHECLVIGSMSGGVADILKNNSTAITFDSTSGKAVDELKGILSQILSPDRTIPLEGFRNLAIQGRTFIEQNYSVESMIKNLEDQYLSL